MKSSTSRSIFSRARGARGARGEADGAADESHQRLDIAIQEEAPGVIRLKVDAAMNEVGILFRLCAVLYCYHWNIQNARINTPGPGAISDEFVIATGEGAATMNADSMRSLIDDLERLLLALSQAFYLMDINIFEAEITTQSDGSVWNRFTVDPNDKRFRSAEFQRRLQEELRVLFWSSLSLSAASSRLRSAAACTASISSP